MPNAPRRPKPPAAAGPDPAPTEAPADRRMSPVDYYWVLAFLFMALGAFVGMLFLHYRNPPEITLATGISAFAPLYVLAQAIERLMEPANHFLKLGGDPKPATAARDAAVARAVATADPGDADIAAAAQREVDALRANRVAICWGLASALAMVGCGYFGIGVLHTIGDTGVPRYVDVIVTGLAVGGGTKPLHDFITSLQSSAHGKKDAAALR
jgi:hypothetical protein